MMNLAFKMVNFVFNMMFVSASGPDRSPGTKASSSLRTIAHALRLTRGWRKKQQET